MPGQKQRAEASAQRPLYQEGAVSGADWGSFKDSPPLIAAAAGFS